MYDLFDANDVALFKARLKAARKNTEYSQEVFAGILGFSGRSSVANWESTKSKVLPSLSDFVRICDLLKVDPNYLLGVNPFPSEEDHAIAERIGISDKNVRILSNSSFTSRIIDFMLSSDTLEQLSPHISRLFWFATCQKIIEREYTPLGLSKIQEAVNYFSMHLYPCEQNKGEFISMLRNRLVWDSELESFSAFYKRIITHDHTLYAEFDQSLSIQSDMKKYSLLIDAIAGCFFPQMIQQPIVELTEAKIISSINSLIHDYVSYELANSSK